MRKATGLYTINPAREEVISRYQIMTQEQIKGKIEKARKIFQDWKSDIKKRIDVSRYGMLELVNLKSVRFYDDQLVYNSRVE